jgi:hypothetical protein
MAAIIQFRRDTASNWTTNDPTLAAGEIGYETDGGGNYKIGNGSTAWTSLGYGGLGDIHRTLIEAKGDLVVGTADDTAGILTAGANGAVLTIDTSTSSGLAWGVADSIVNWHEAVKLATTAALGTATYSNGTAGVGATLTHNPASTPGGYARLVVDGANATTGDRVLIQDQAAGLQNGYYDVTAQGVNGTSAWVLTRAVDLDGSPAGQIKSGESVYVLSGATNSGQGFVVTSTSDPHTVGTHAITFTQFTGTQAFTAGTGLSITGNTINAGTASASRIVVNADDIDLAASGVSAASYGSVTQVGTFTVDTYGRLTAATNATIAIPSTAVTDFTEAVQDVAGAQVATNGSHTGIGATYDDAGDGAIDLTLTASGVSAASYGSATQVPGYTVDTYGRLTAASNTTIAIPSTAVTDFTEAVQDVAGAQVVTNGSHTGLSAAYDDAGDGAIDLSLTNTGVSAASYGSATQVPGYTVDVKGRLTAASNTTIAIPSTAVTDFAEAVQDVSGAQLVTNGSHTHLTAAYDDAGDGAIDIALNVTAVTGGSYGSATQVPNYTVDAYGRLTAAANTTIAVPSTAVTDFAEAVQDVSGAQLATNGSHTGITATYDDAGDGAVDLALITENVQDIAGAQLATNGSHTGLTATYDDAGDGAIDLALVTENVQDITGAQIATNGTHVGLTAAYDDAGDGAVDLTVAATLGTHTSGNYVATVAGTANEVNVSGSGSETAAVVVGLPDDVTIAGVLTVSGSIADGAIATTQAQSNNSTKLATTAYVDVGLGALSSDSITDADADTKIQVEESADEDIIRFDTAGTERMSIGATGTVTIVGDLTVNGTTTTVNSTTLTVDDKNIEIGSVATPSDTTADGGGITLKGATDKTWNWVNSTDAWTSSEHIALATGKSVYIDGVLQLSKNALAATVVLADGVAATTQSANDSTTKVATTAFVMTEIGDYAPLASPTLTGVPAAPTAAADTNTTQIATTAYVQTELGAISSDSLTDADGDTLIQVEESADEDIIRFDAAGEGNMATISTAGLYVRGPVVAMEKFVTETGTAYTLQVEDRGKMVTMNNASASTLTVPPQGTGAGQEEWFLGQYLRVTQLGAGQVTITAGAGVTLRYTPGLKIRAQYSSCTLTYIGTNEWLVIGDLDD